ncbi:LysR family transcriptional regulator [Salinicola sp. MIT1003]|uniref:LysR family transcriptional regulator n=1 Tax=Salinicola sp. MIT1003 TaxID=1882734 RepID=UPI0009F3C711|nr:LysR family transcriptional regulator [Salinicola sp. MIT1003]
MKRCIPSTTALITFEAVARLGGVSRAANELCLTESAVSKQITKLEDYLGIKLFDRAHGRVVLSRAGYNYSIEVCKILDDLEKETKSIIGYDKERKELRIAVLPTFSNKWLLPRLNNFCCVNNDITINIIGQVDPANLQESEFDAAIHFEDPKWAELRQQTLFSEELITVISPKHFDALSWHDNVLKIALLHKASRDDAWKRWFSQTHIRHSNPASGPRYDSYANIIEAVRSGMGVGLVPKFYVEPELESGELVQPSPYVLKNEKTYTLIFPESESLPTALNLFIDWIMQEAHLFMQERNAENLQSTRRPISRPTLAL